MLFWFSNSLTIVTIVTILIKRNLFDTYYIDSPTSFFLLVETLSELYAEKSLRKKIFQFNDWRIQELKIIWKSTKSWWLVVGNKANLKTGVSRKQSTSNFKKFDVLCFLETPVLRFALSPYYRRIRSYQISMTRLRGIGPKYVSKDDGKI